MNVAEYERMHAAEERQWWYTGMRAISFGLLDAATDSTATAPSPLRYLDAGCGTGLNLGHLAERGRAVGLDLSEEAVRFCRSRGVSAVRGNVLQLPLRSGSMDGVTSFDVLYHAWVTDDRAAVRELARVLRPGGRLLVRVPALKLLWGAHDEAVLSRHRYDRGELRALLESAGLVVERLSYCNSILFPLLLLRRTLDRVLDRHGSDVEFLPAPLEWAFKRALLLEAALIGRGFDLPVGASLVALARKP
jgi:SAM-dependent methyltransferase